ncbi:N-acetylmuramoyl-L-alanine amidase family protein [Mucilaginibacter sp.]
MKNKALKRLICGLAALMLLFTLCSFKTETTARGDTAAYAGFKFKTVIIDAGHGGHDPGAYGSYSTEKKVTLAIAEKLQTAIEKDIPEVNAVMTRTDDNFIELHKRAEIANHQHGNMFISIHCNSLPDNRRMVNGRSVRVNNRSGKGVLLLVYGFKRTGEQLEAIRENASIYQEKNYKDYYNTSDDPSTGLVLNAFRDKYRKQSIHLANLINDEFVNNDGRRSNGVKEQSLHVLANSGMPAVLVETGFINNPEDEEYLNSEQGQNEIVASIVRAIKQYKKEVEQAAAN